MAYNAIASGSAILTTNADGLKSGLDKAAKDIDGWGKQVSGGFSKGGAGGKGFGGAITGAIAGLSTASGGLFAGAGSLIGAGLAAAISGGPAAPIGAAIGGLVGRAIGGTSNQVFGAAKAIGGVIVEGLGAAKDTLADMSKQGDIAQALGLTAEQFTGIAGVAKSVGEDTREFIESLVTMGKLGADAAAGTEQASAAFKSLGLNANEFLKLRADEQFLRIFGALSKLQPGVDKQRLLMQAFGEDGGKYLLPLLKKAPADLQKMAAGLAISTSEMKRAQAATAAWAQLQITVDKVWRGLAVAASGPLRAIATGVTIAWDSARASFDDVVSVGARLWGRLQPRVQPLFDWLEEGWRGVRRVVDLAWSGLQSLVVPAVEQIVTWVERAIDATAEWSANLFGFARWPAASELVVEGFRKVGTAAAYTWDTFKAGAGIVAIVASDFVKAWGNVADALNTTIKEMARVGYAVAKMNDRHGLAAEFQSLYYSADKFGDKLRTAGEELRLWGGGTLANFGKGAQQFNAWLDKMLQPNVLKNVTEAGKSIAEGFMAGVGATIQQKAPEVFAPLKLSGAILKGSKEAYSLIVKNQFGGGSSNDPAKKQLDEAKKANKKHDEANKRLGAITDRFDKLGVV